MTSSSSIGPVAEKNFKLGIEPKRKLVFLGDPLGEIVTSMKIMNRSDSKQAFKVKCSRNDLFRIRPTMGILKCKQSACINITYRCQNHLAPESGRHHFGIYHIPAPEGCTAAGAWAEHYGPPQGEVRLKAYFESGDSSLARDRLDNYIEELPNQRTRNARSL